ncbi:hypothetical protein, partial [Caldifermentibacillus hisashii]|uniref:hypothetical protein n=1 Tax=Caldifermentibacillus hisashii TaxID=996558 RepID=UPI0022B9C475
GSKSVLIAGRSSLYVAKRALCAFLKSYISNNKANLTAAGNIKNIRCVNKGILERFLSFDDLQVAIRTGKVV